MKTIGIQHGRLWPQVRACYGGKMRVMEGISMAGIGMAGIGMAGIGMAGIGMAGIGARLLSLRLLLVFFLPVLLLGAPGAAAQTLPTLSIAAVEATVTEGDPVRFLVTASPAPGADLTVNINVADVAGSDFVAAANEGLQTVVVNRIGEGTLTVPTVGDTVTETAGSVTATLAADTASPATYALGTTVSASVALSDPATPRRALGVGFATTQATTVQVTEGERLTLDLSVTGGSDPREIPLTLDFATGAALTDLSAAQLADTSVFGRIAAGETDGSLVVLGLAPDDNIVGPIRTGTATLNFHFHGVNTTTAITGASQLSIPSGRDHVTLEIHDDDRTFIGLRDGNLGSLDVLDFMRQLAFPLVAHVSVSGGTTRRIEVAAGVLRTSLGVAASDVARIAIERPTYPMHDGWAALTRPCMIWVDPVTPGSPLPPVAMGAPRCTVNQEQVSLSASPNPVAEGDPVIVTATLSAALTQAVTIPLTLTPGTAAADDYGALPSITIAAGQTTGTGAITTVQDADSTDGTFTVAIDIFNLPSAVAVQVGGQASVLVTIEDDDAAELVLAPAILTVVEGATNTYTVALASQPTGDVTVIVSGQAGTDLTLDTDSVTQGDQATLTFTTANWNTPQTVTLSAAQDADAVNDSVTLTHTASGGNYASVTGDLPVTVTDNDTAGVTVSEAALTVAFDGNAAYTLVLDSQPAGDVTVTPAAAGGRVTVSGPLTFTAADWATPQQVTVAGRTPGEARITHTAQSQDANYNGISIDDVTVTVGADLSAVLPAWLGRFGRTVGEQVLEGVTARFDTARAPGAEATVAGRTLRFGAAAEMNKATSADKGFLAGAGSGLADGADAVRYPGYPSSPANPPVHPAGPTGDVAGGDGWRLGDLLRAGSFSVTRQADAASGTLGFWGRVARSEFDGREDGLRLDGEVTTGLLGVDYGRNNWLAGVVLSQTDSDGEYEDDGNGSGELEAELTAATAYGAYDREGLRFWGAAGRGRGELMLTADGLKATADTDWTLAAAGVTGQLLEAPAAGGPELALKADGLWTRTESERADWLPAAEADVTLLRLGLAGRWVVPTADGGSVTPALALGVRNDGGDAETGFGVELGGGLAWRSPGRGLTLDVKGRTLLGHEDEELKDWGLSMGFAYDLRPETERGLSLSLKQAWGSRADGGLAALFARDPLAERAGTDAGARWELEAAYGMSAFGSAFTGSPHLGLGVAADSRDLTLGWRWVPVWRSALPLTVDLKLIRRESGYAVDDVEHTVGVELNLDF